MEHIFVDFKGYTITTDKSLMKPSEVFHWLCEISYWAKGIPEDTFMRSFENSFCIGALKNGRQVGFGRLITDYATFPEKFTRSKHMPTVLYKIGMGFLALKQKEDAHTFFQELLDKFHKSPEAKKAREKLKK